MGGSFLDLTKAITGGTGNTPVTSPSGTLPLTSNQRMILAHGIILSLAFLLLLPIGALQARLLRTIVPGKVWFTAHWVLQWPISGTLIIIGFALAVAEVQNVGKKHFVAGHQVCLFQLHFLPRSETV